MTKTELKTLYVHACVRAGTKPNATEEGAWQKAYAYTDRADFEAAIDAHFRSQKFLPRESELYPLIDSARRSRETRESGEQDYVRFRCPQCGATFSGFRDPGDCRTSVCYASPSGNHQGIMRGGRRECGIQTEEISRHRCERDQRGAAARAFAARYGWPGEGAATGKPDA